MCAGGSGGGGSQYQDGWRRGISLMHPPSRDAQCDSRSRCHTVLVSETGTVVATTAERVAAPDGMTTGVEGVGRGVEVRTERRCAHAPPGVWRPTRAIGERLPGRGWQQEPPAGPGRPACQGPGPLFGNKRTAVGSGRASSGGRWARETRRDPRAVTPAYWAEGPTLSAGSAVRGKHKSNEVQGPAWATRRKGGLWRPVACCHRAPPCCGG